MINKIVKILDKLINFITIIFFIIVLAFGLYAIYDAYYIYDNAKLSDEIITLKPKEGEKDFSLASLQEINPDICGWIRIDDTNIDYPIAIGVDNSEYLNIDYKKEYSTAGSIFLDYRNDRDFKDDYSIIYGHNMKADLMFADIKKFVEPQYFEQHDSGTLYTSSGIYKIDILCIARVNAFSDDIYNLLIFKNGRTNELLKSFNSNSIFKRQLEFTQKDKMILLSTCDSAGSNDRLVLATKISRQDEGNEIINEGTGSSLEKLEEQKEIIDESSNTVVNNSVAQEEVKTKKYINIHLSARNIVLIVLSIIVIIIFLIAIIKRLNVNKKEKGKHSK